jgi:hypothetical protein
VKSSQAFRLLLKRAPGGRRKSSEWLEAHATFLIAPLSRDGEGAILRLQPADLLKRAGNR